MLPLRVRSCLQGLPPVATWIKNSQLFSAVDPENHHVNRRFLLKMRCTGSLSGYMSHGFKWEVDNEIQISSIAYLSKIIFDVPCLIERQSTRTAGFADRCKARHQADTLTTWPRCTFAFCAICSARILALPTGWSHRPGSELRVASPIRGLIRARPQGIFRCDREKLDCDNSAAAANHNVPAPSSERVDSQHQVPN